MAKVVLYFQWRTHCNASNEACSVHTVPTNVYIEYTWSMYISQYTGMCIFTHQCTGVNIHTHTHTHKGTHHTHIHNTHVTNRYMHLFAKHMHTHTRTHTNTCTFKLTHTQHTSTSTKIHTPPLTSYLCWSRNTPAASIIQAHCRIASNLHIPLVKFKWGRISRGQDGIHVEIIHKMKRGFAVSRQLQRTT